MKKLPLLDADLNDHIEPTTKFYKRKSFWLTVLTAISLGIVGDYSAVVPVALEIFNGLTV